MSVHKNKADDYDRMLLHPNVAKDYLSIRELFTRLTVAVYHKEIGVSKKRLRKVIDEECPEELESRIREFHRRWGSESTMRARREIMQERKIKLVDGSKPI